jgi:hypothetical protein
MHHTSHPAPSLHRVTQRVKLSLALLTLTACEPDEPDPCTVDAFGCEYPAGTLPIDDACTDTLPLTVAIGWGDTRFHTFAEGHPEVHDGIQGGQHIFASFQASGAELDAVPMVELGLYSFGPISEDQCRSEVENLRTWDPASLPADARTGTFDPAPGLPPIVIGYAPVGLTELPAFGPSRCISLGSVRQLLVEVAPEQVASGLLETNSILLQLPFSTSPNVLFAVTVRDACGETGTATAAVSLPR